MSDDSTKVSIKYIEEGVKNLTNTLNQFVGSTNEKFAGLDKTYVRADWLALKLQELGNGIKNLDEANKNRDKRLDEICEHKEMLSNIKKERESVRNQIINVAGKVMFYIVAAVLGVAALKK